MVSFPASLQDCSCALALILSPPPHRRKTEGDSSKNCMFHITLTEYPKLPPYPPGESTEEAKIPWIHHLFGMTRRGYLGEHITIFGEGGQKPVPYIRTKKSHRPGSHIAALVCKSLVLRIHLKSAYQGTKRTPLRRSSRNTAEPFHLHGMIPDRSSCKLSQASNTPAL